MLIHGRIGILHPLRVFFRKIAFINELAHPLLAEVIVALVHRDLINPSQQRTTEIEVLDREINLRKDLLGDIFRIVMVAQDAEDDREDLGLVALHDFAEGHFIPGLDAPDQSRFFSIAVIHSALCLRFGARSRPRNRKVEYASKAVHTTSETHPNRKRLQSFGPEKRSWWQIGASLRGSLASNNQFSL